MLGHPLVSEGVVHFQGKVSLGLNKRPGNLELITAGQCFRQLQDCAMPPVGLMHVHHYR